MVTVSGYAVRQNQQGEEFVVLILQGDLEMVKKFLVIVACAKTPLKKLEMLKKYLR